MCARSSRIAVKFNELEERMKRTMNCSEAKLPVAMLSVCPSSDVVTPIRDGSARCESRRAPTINRISIPYSTSAEKNKRINKITVPGEGLANGRQHERAQSIVFFSQPTLRSGSRRRRRGGLRIATK